MGGEGGLRDLLEGWVPGGGGFGFGGESRMWSGGTGRTGGEGGPALGESLMVLLLGGEVVELGGRGMEGDGLMPEGLVMGVVLVGE